MWPRRKRWSLMGSLAPPITSRFGVAAQEFYPKGNVPSPNYEFFDEESGGWSADKNNAAINAAMARQAQIPQYDHTMGAGAGSAAKKKGLSLKNMINAMSKMKAPTGMDFGRAGGRVGGSRPTAPSPRALGVDALQMASADDPRKKWWKQWQGLMGA